MTWTQPLCRACWNRDRPHDQPHVLTEPKTEICCMCGHETRDGIYVRYNPNAVPYPTED